MRRVSVTYVGDLGFGSIVISGGDHPFLLYDEGEGHFVNLCPKTDDPDMYGSCECGHIAVWAPGNDCEIGTYMTIEVRMPRHDRT